MKTLLEIIEDFLAGFKPEEIEAASKTIIESNQKDWGDL